MGAQDAASGCLCRRSPRDGRGGLRRIRREKSGSGRVPPQPRGAGADRVIRIDRLKACTSCAAGRGDASCLASTDRRFTVHLRRARPVCSPAPHAVEGVMAHLGGRDPRAAAEMRPLARSHQRAGSAPTSMRLRPITAPTMRLAVSGSGMKPCHPVGSTARASVRNGRITSPSIPQPSRPTGAKARRPPTVGPMIDHQRSFHSSGLRSTSIRYRQRSEESSSTTPSSRGTRIDTPVYCPWNSASRSTRTSNRLI